jgi:hypothetical protein
VSLLLGLLGVGVAVEARAQGASNAECRPNPHLSRANQFYEDLQFDEAAQTLQRAIEYASNCRWDLGEIYRLKAFVDAINGERERCHRDFEIFLAINPEYKMDINVPPKILNCFESARAIAPSRRHLDVEHSVDAQVKPNAPVAIRIRLEDRLRLIDKVQVFFRRQGVKAFTALTTRADDEVTVIIPALSIPADPKSYKIEYIVRGVDRWGGIFVEDGNTRYPLEFTVLPGSLGGEKVVKQWWFWTAVAVGISGIGFGLYSAFGGDPDTVTLRITESGANE